MEDKELNVLVNAAYSVATSPSVASYGGRGATHGVYGERLVRLLEALRPFVPDRILPELEQRVAAQARADAELAAWRAAHVH